MTGMTDKIRRASKKVTGGPSLEAERAAQKLKGDAQQAVGEAKKPKRRSPTKFDFISHQKAKSGR